MEDDHIVAMEQFEGLTYLMRGSSNTMQAWDLTTGTFVGEMDLPRIAAQDSWAEFVELHVFASVVNKTLFGFRKSFEPWHTFSSE